MSVTDVPPADSCTWNEGEYGPWETDCGGMFEWIEGGPKENGAKFCLYCGKPITVNPYCHVAVEPS